MAEKELTLFLVLVNVVLLIFIGGFCAFVFLLRQRKIQFKRETELLEQIYQQQLVERQLDTQQQTMRDIGREIHDNVGQKLTLASIYSQGLLHRQLLPTTETALQIGEIAKLIDTSLQELRQISRTLVYPESAQKTLNELLEQEAALTNQLELCNIHLGLPPFCLILTTFEKNNIFRITQEFIQNSLKHSRCHNIWICVELQSTNLVFTFKDDGMGFEIGTQNTGIGLVNIKRRLGNLKVLNESLTSALGHGTTLHFSILYQHVSDEI